MSFEIRDPIHTRIACSLLERGLIDHPFFQRLRFVGQLGFLQSYVYPGAVHDRFSHALGAMHVAGRLYGQLFTSSSLGAQILSQEEREQIKVRLRLAGLLHDIGHGPFSHSSEIVFPRFWDLPLDRSWFIPSTFDRERQATHEDYSVLLIQTLVNEGVLEREVAQDVCRLIHAQCQGSETMHALDKRIPGLSTVLKQLISGEVDCDRMDYLLRDSYFCGVAYGNYDIDWLISSLSLAQHDGQLILTLNENGVRAFETVLLARYHMIDQVYGHKTKNGFTHYLEQAIQQSEILLTIPTDPYAYTQLRDGTVLELLFDAARSPGHYWSSRLMRRIPAKRIMRFFTLREEDQQTLARVKRVCIQSGIKHFEHAISKNLTHFGEGKEMDSTLFVAKKTFHETAFVPLYVYSDLLQKYHERLQFTDFFVHTEDNEAFATLEKNGEI